VSVSTQEHRAIVERLFPDREIRTLDVVHGGWTSSTYLLNDEWIVQVASSAYAAERVRAQIGFLPELAHELSALVPVPERVSVNPPAMAYRAIVGTRSDRGPDGIWPERLGRFLYDLHLTPPEFVGLRGTTAPAVRAGVAAVLDTMRSRVLPLLEPGERDHFSAAFRRFLDDDAQWRFAPCLTHGDLGPAHILVSDTGDLAGVIDWEDLAVGDPAWDHAWLLNAAPGVGERVLAAYGGAPDPTFRRRASFSFGLMPFHDVLHGLDGGGDAFVDIGIEGIRARAQPPA
jgi:aminoglycoside phosphotransferase (APT) family kinase protein